MTAPLLGEIRLFPYGKVPKGFAPCDGRLLDIKTNTALFSIIGVQYGGDGRTEFALPNLQGRVVLHTIQPNNGRIGGEESHTLTIAEMPEHSHGAMAAGNATTTDPANALWGTSTVNNYGVSQAIRMNGEALTLTGGSQPHPNMQPYLTLNYCIAINGIYPSRPD